MTMTAGVSVISETEYAEPSAVCAVIETHYALDNGNIRTAAVLAKQIFQRVVVTEKAVKIERRCADYFFVEHRVDVVRTALE